MNTPEFYFLRRRGGALLCLIHYLSRDDTASAARELRQLYQVRVLVLHRMNVVVNFSGPAKAALVVWRV